jgi:hypothetical protein
MEADIERAAALMAEGRKACAAADFAAANRCFEQALAIRRGVLGETHPDWLAASTTLESWRTNWVITPCPSTKFVRS